MKGNWQETASRILTEREALADENIRLERKLAALRSLLHRAVTLSIASSDAERLAFRNACFDEPALTEKS